MKGCPLCLVWEIRRRCPSDNGKYTDFKNSIEEVPEIYFSWVGGGGNGTGTYLLLLVVLFSRHINFNYVVASFNQFYFNITIFIKETKFLQWAVQHCIHQNI